MKDQNNAITIFSKNGITIKKCRLRYCLESGIVMPTYRSTLGPTIDLIKYGIADYSASPSRTNSSGHYEYIKTESPLGFYYDKKVWVDGKHQVETTRESKSKNIIKVAIYGIDSDYVYNISYLTEYHGTNINNETRPWDLTGGTFPDNYIFGLLDDINKIFDDIESYKYTSGMTYVGYPYTSKDASKITVREVRNKVMIDLFGDVRGPRFQTNDEKILAHGFDLKTSFRKM